MSDVQIHPTAIVDPGAQIGARTMIGPYCVIGPNVVLGQSCWLQHHVTLAGPMRTGAKNKFYAYCSIGQQTQDLKYAGEPTYLEISDENTFREFVTVNRSTTAEVKRGSGTVEIILPTATSATIARLGTRLSFRTTERSPVMSRWAITRS